MLTLALFCLASSGTCAVSSDSTSLCEMNVALMCYSVGQWRVGRLDGFMVSQRLLPRVQSYHVLDVAEAISSPHRPVLIQLKAAEELAGG